MKLGIATERPEQVIGIHFFNPVPVLRARRAGHDPADVARDGRPGRRFATDVLGKRVIRSQDRAGFVVNALLIPYLLSAIRMMESGFATADDIDTGMVEGCNHPMGPLPLADLIGLDTTLAVAEPLRGVQGAACTRRRRCCRGWSRPACSAARPAAASTTTRARQQIAMDLLVAGRRAAPRALRRVGRRLRQRPRRPQVESATGRRRALQSLRPTRCRDPRCWLRHRPGWRLAGRDGSHPPRGLRPVGGDAATKCRPQCVHRTPPGLAARSAALRRRPIRFRRVGGGVHARPRRRLGVRRTGQGHLTRRTRVDRFATMLSTTSATASNSNG